MLNSHKLGLKFNARNLIGQKQIIRSFSEQVQEKQTKKENNIDTNIIRESSEKHSFQTETKKLLHIVANSLYTDKDVFLRELLSNSSDAIEKQRYLELTGESVNEDPLQINILTNEKKRQLILQDTGIGMDKQEMIDNLGTIASSGSRKFLEQLGKGKNTQGVEESLIGQFGVGFYSAFIVGDTVEVFSKRENDEKAHCWISDGSGTYEIAEAENFHLSRGTRIVIHLKPEFSDFSKDADIKKIIDKYSNFINHPIYLNHERVKVITAIWAYSKSELKEKQYKEFFEYISKSKQAYKYKLHYHVEVPLSIKSVLFVPKSNPEMFGMNSTNLNVDLYSRKVLIKKDCKDLLPNYLRFMKGVVDCEDLPLNISRENYQDSNLIAKLREVLTKRVLNLLKQEAQKNLESFNLWQKDFHMYLKEGLHSDKKNSDLLLNLCRFDSTFKTQISLDDYLKEMKTGQKVIYFFLAQNKEFALSSPYMEIYLKNDIPVLFISINIEEMIFRDLVEYKQFKFINIENQNVEIPKELLKEELDLEDEKPKLPKEDVSNFSMWIKNELQPVVSTVKISNKLSNSPAIISSHVTSGMRQMMAFMNHQELDQASKNLTMEINPNHKIMIHLNKLRKFNSKRAGLNLKQILDSCMLNIGIPFDTKNFIQRTNQYIENDLQRELGDEKESSEAEVVEEPIIIEEDKNN